MSIFRNATNFLKSHATSPNILAGYWFIMQSFTSILPHLSPHNLSTLVLSCLGWTDRNHLTLYFVKHRVGISAMLNPYKTIATTSAVFPLMWHWRAPKSLSHILYATMATRCCSPVGIRFWHSALCQLHFNISEINGQY